METERDFDPSTMTRATLYDVSRMMDRLWGPRENGELLDQTQTQETTMTRYSIQDKNEHEHPRQYNWYKCSCGLPFVEIDGRVHDVCANCGKSTLETIEAINFVLSHTTEQTADDLAALVAVVNASEPLGAVDVQQASDWQDEGCGNDSDLYDYARGG